ncbi:hypothetical protein EYC80_004878 [Monilinia laxa]|uniref:Uncharacterized protein n=1 Tax=Monilinia laxa TaxID=61186 RepID=A0A5N6KI54_MONLA|nr:hypothetical protein EYC80_004878 [Monilinia laxa]
MPNDHKKTAMYSIVPSLQGCQTLLKQEKIVNTSLLCVSEKTDIVNKGHQVISKKTNAGYNRSHGSIPIEIERCMHRQH